MPQDDRVHFNKLQLEKKIRNLAGRHESTLKTEPIKAIAPLLEVSREILTEAYRELALAAKRKKELSSAAEWLIDNFYIIQEQIVQLKEDLPPSYYQKMPRLVDGEYAGFPRVYELIQVLSKVSDNVLDQENAAIAVQSYQETKTLNIGELWAVPIMIRLVLLVRLTERVKELKDHRAVKDRVNSQLGEILEEESEEPGFLLRNLSGILAEQHNEKIYLRVLAQQMQSRGLLTDTERSWFDYKFRPWHSTLEDELRSENQRTSRLQLSIQNAIASLREVSENDWKDFVEDNSIIERILRLDPAGYYPNMAFKTRDRYRKVVEKLSIHSSLSESDVAERALLLGEEGGQKSGKPDPKEQHIGYYLIDEGFPILAEEIEYRMPPGERLRRWSEKRPAVYFGSITLHLLVLLAIVTWLSGLLQAQPWMIAITLGAALFPALELAIVSTNRILSLILPPRMLPRLKIVGDIRDEFRTLVVVPTLFSSPEDVRSQFEALEIRALANPNRSLQFALLSDYTDSRNETMPGDREILETALEEVRRLNKRYGSNYGDKFYLLHRERRWNEKQNRWMGWERKRGKLEEANKLLRDPDAQTSYTTVTGDFMESVHKIPVQYVITLDADTKLPPGSALHLISTA
ncbi:MAG TPA: hypothetical protein VK074_05845, partial [Fodinibius sp.]|nr:hypothetical protein [Fodinibius sp.]